MKIAIIGLANCGKTTVFNALTRGTARTANYSSARLEPNLATVKVPDPRLQVLNNLYNPRKLTPAEVQYVDIGGISGGAEKGGGLAPELLNYVGGSDALLHVVRAFEDSNVPHPFHSVDLQRDIETVDLELILSDLAIVEKRLERLQKEIKKLPPQERRPSQTEQELLQRVQQQLLQERPVRDLALEPNERKMLRGFQLLTAKPVLLALNTGEESIAHPPQIQYSHVDSEVVSISARVEAELAQLEEDEALEFMQELQIREAARDRVIAASYRLLGLVSFLTVGEDEVRAWTIRMGANAAEAGAAIHSDIQRGFIRAEVVTYENLIEAGKISEARKRGLLRLEGKQYVVQDGDICNFLFNV